MVLIDFPLLVSLWIKNADFIFNYSSIRLHCILKQNSTAEQNDVWNECNLSSLAVEVLKFNHHKIYLLIFVANCTNLMNILDDNLNNLNLEIQYQVFLGLFFFLRTGDSCKSKSCIGEYCCGCCCCC